MSWVARLARIGAVLGALGFAVLGGMAPAQAHAELVGVVPADGQALASSPREIRLTFTEDVVALGTAVRVTDAAGTVVPVESASVSRAQVTARLPELDPGAYVLTWRVVCDDGHVLSGTSTFSVAGAAAVGGEHQVTESGPLLPVESAGQSVVRHAAGSDGDGTAVLRIVAETAGLLGTALASGALLLWWCLGLTGQPWLRRLATVGALLLAAATTLCIASLAADAVGPSTQEPIWEAWRVVVSTTAGTGLCIRLVAGVLAAWLAWYHRPGYAALTCAVGAAAFALSVTSPSGDHPLAGLLVVAAHVLAASVWAGSVLVLLALIVALPLTTGQWWQVRRAVIAVTGPMVAAAALALASGIVLASTSLPSWQDLYRTGYGALLTVKASLVVVLAGLALAWIRAGRRELVDPPRPVLVPAAVGGGAEPSRVGSVNVRPAQRNSPPPGSSPSRAMRRRLHAQAAVLVVVLACSAVLAHLSPPPSAARSAPGDDQLAEASSSGASATVGRALTTDAGVRLRLVMTSPQPATLKIDIQLDGNGATGGAAGAGDPDPVVVADAHPDGTVLPPTPLRLQRVGSGRFVSSAVPLAPPGPWRVSVQVTGEDGRTSAASTTVTVP